ncbi:APH(3') family aminoglycoside O-phosphotransferase [Chitinophaga qingshengii]|uniref:Aminoglycoside 3'-phosphotransferase n=1 Tax=Chitinophaga qingshengii TaxID=1569794 RepID=A0ABR7TGV1_9BACT|nr:APH(3') family aminoglycoside O-phosphotransferase [Chitinophaga qingshengii]MBC9929190.1 aminoglycoside 3'-phosphotransferase [Chitinophaga qingshengii]
MPNLPTALAHLLTDMQPETVTIGYSAAGVYRYTSDHSVFYLKTQPSGQGLHGEYAVLTWLQDKLPVPAILYFGTHDDTDYLLTTAMEGDMLCAAHFLDNPELTVKLLADGIKLLSAVPIADCPFDNRLEHKLEAAARNIQQGLVDTSDWETNHRFTAPQALLDYLIAHQPAQFTPVFTHGDYCLPNIFGNQGRVSGFIDIGGAGIADAYQDIALCVRSLKHNFGSDDYAGLFFDMLGIERDEERVEYYVLLDELF